MRMFIGRAGPLRILGSLDKKLRALPTNDRHCNWLQICGELKQTTNTQEKSITRRNFTIAELNMAMSMFAQLLRLIMSEKATVRATAQVFLVISHFLIYALSWYWSEWLELLVMAFILVMLVFVERCLLSSNEWGSDWWCAGCTQIPSYLLHPGHAHYAMVIIIITVIIITIIIMWRLHLVRFPNPLTPGSQIHVSWGTRLGCPSVGVVVVPIW